MWWYIIISIIIIIALIALAWKLKYIQHHPWITVILCLLATVSIFCGRWHYYYEPLKYNHILDKSIDNESKFKNAVTTYKKYDTGWTSDLHPFKHQELKNKRNDTQTNLQKLRNIKAPHNLSNRQSKIKAQHATIRALRYQLKQYKNID